MRKQPNFTKIFYEYFGKIPRKVNYQIRNDCNRLHDLSFFNTLIHDSRFKRSDVKLRGKRLTIPILRECFELPEIIIKHDKKNNMQFIERYYCKSKIIFWPVREIKWSFEQEVDFSPDIKFEIQGLSLTRISFDFIKLTIDGFGWECALMIGEDSDSLVVENKFAACVTDIEIPKLYNSESETS